MITTRPKKQLGELVWCPRNETYSGSSSPHYLGPSWLSYHRSELPASIRDLEGPWLSVISCLVVNFGNENGSLDRNVCLKLWLDAS